MATRNRRGGVGDDTAAICDDLGTHELVSTRGRAEHRSQAPLRTCPPAGRPDHVWSRLPIYFPVRLRTGNGDLLGAWTIGNQVSPRAPTVSRVAQERASRPNITYDCAHQNAYTPGQREQPHKTKTGDTKREMDTTAHRRKKYPCPADAVRFTRAAAPSVPPQPLQRRAKSLSARNCSLNLSPSSARSKTRPAHATPGAPRNRPTHTCHNVAVTWSEDK